MMGVLQESLDIRNVAECKRTYQQWMQDNDVLIVDARSVSRVDAAGIQLLASLFRTAHLAGKEIRLDNISEALEEGLQVLGMEHCFKVIQEGTRKT